MYNKTSLISVKELLGSSAKYIIPMYQRNYAWEVNHIRQLIQDIWDSALNNNGRKYYIGTLVVYLRENGGFEIVDGQQRMTSLHLIMCALKNEIDCDGLDLGWYKAVNILYEYRERSGKSLEALFEHTNDQDVSDEAMKANYRQVMPLMNGITGGDVKRFCDYFFNKVYITRVVLPGDTNLNLYFEIMNSRGEQLEKHEVLKARLLNAVRNEGDSGVSRFMKLLWDACSNMNRFVQMGFEASLRNIIFTDDWSSFTWHGFDGLYDACKEKINGINEGGQGKNDLNETAPFSIDDIFKDHDGIKVGQGAADDDPTRFSSVVNFPNFLLHVLRIMTCEDVPLDDKRLIETFDDKCGFTPEGVKRFMFELLRMRFYFDKFVVKRDYIDNAENGDWKIYTLSRSASNQYSYELINTFADSRAVMAQLMFHVSLPSQNYKHWLTAVLYYISMNNGSGEGLVEYLERLSRAYMLDRFFAPCGAVHDYYEIVFKNAGTPVNRCPDDLRLPGYNDNIDNFVFNYLDYQLWKSDKNRYKAFRFTFRSSVEHFHPQHPIENIARMDDRHLHSFGNLCLISSSKNSRLSNYSPLAKTEHYRNGGIDSIKQRIMMDTVEKLQRWTEKDIDSHEEDMRQVFVNSLR